MHDVTELESLPRRRMLLRLAMGLLGLAARVPRSSAAATTAGCDAQLLCAKLSAALGLDARTVSVWFEGASRRQLDAVARVHDIRVDRIAALTVTDLRTQLRERIKADFRAGLITNVGGWQLTVTEAAMLSAIHRWRGKVDGAASGREPGAHSTPA